MAADAVDEAQLRDLIPGVLAALVHRGADFATAEDAVQEALIRAVETWPNRRPDDPKGWLITTAWRRFVDLARSDIARHRREQQVSEEPPPGPTESADHGGAALRGGRLAGANPRRAEPPHAAGGHPPPPPLARRWLSTCSRFL
jgi:predicted RNA polymerase sigma factor